MEEERNANMDEVASLGAMASEIGYAVQFKSGAALIATIPPDFFVAQNSYMKVLYDEAPDEETKGKLASIMEVYSLAITFSMKYRKVMRAEELLHRKEMSDAAQKQGSEGERSDRKGNEGKKEKPQEGKEEDKRGQETLEKEAGPKEKESTKDT